VVVQTPEGSQIDFKVIKHSKTSTQGDFERIFFTFNSSYHKCTRIFKIPKEIADASEDVQQDYVERTSSSLCESAPPEFREKSQICTCFLLQLALFDRQRAEAELTRWIQTWQIGTQLFFERGSTCYQGYSLVGGKLPGVTPEIMFKERALTNPTSIYEIFYFAKSTVPASARQGEQAPIIKQDPIAVQWQSYLSDNTAEFAGHPFTDYMLPVTLHGTDQSSSNGQNQADQSNYRSVVDPDDGAIQFFVPSYIDVGLSTWVSFGVDVDGFSGNSRYTWLRSPLYFTYGAAYIDYDGYVDYFNVYDMSFGLRPACWVKIEDQ
jgi:hypothetical protein